MPVKGPALTLTHTELENYVCAGKEGHRGLQLGQPATAQGNISY